MKILFVTPAFYPAFHYGGPIYSTYELAKALKKQNLDVKVITTNANGKERLKVKTGKFFYLDNELPVKYYKSLDSRGTSLSMILNLRKEVKNSDLVYLISVFSPPTPFIIILSIIYKKKLVISPRGQLGEWCINQGSRLKKLWLKLFIKPFLFDFWWHLTALDEQNDLLSVLPRARTFVIPNGIDKRFLKIKNYNKDKLFFKKYSKIVTENSKVIVSLGRLHKKKGFDVLIHAYKKVKMHIQEAVLFIAGEDFGEKDNLIKLIYSENLEEKIFIIGHIEGEEKINFLKNADIFALASRHENFGLVYGEALAAGTPIVASKYTPWQDADKQNFGRWCENTPDQFANAIIKILQSDSIKMGMNGKKFIEENVSWDKIAKEFLLKIKEINYE